MRSTQIDSSNAITFSGDDPDGPGGRGLAQPGNIPYSWTRTATGAYTYNFDTALVPISITTTINAYNGNAATSLNQWPGSFAIQTLYNGALANARRAWTCTARKGV